MRYINCLNNISAKGTDLLGSDYQLTDDIAQASGVLVRSAAMHDMDLPEDLLAVARAGAGVNNIPLDKCAEAGIVVFNTPGANANAVKELVLCGMLLASRGILPGAAWCREHADSPTIGKDAEKAKKAFAGQEISGKTLGVIGLGAIGALVANAAIDLGMNVLGYDPYVSAEAAWRLSPSVEHVTNLDDVLHRSDYVTIHVPAMDSTRGMIGAHELEVAKPGCSVMNFSRDTLVDNAAMAEALGYLLRNGWFGPSRLTQTLTDCASISALSGYRVAQVIAALLPSLAGVRASNSLIEALVALAGDYGMGVPVPEELRPKMKGSSAMAKALRALDALPDAPTGLAREAAEALDAVRVRRE